MLKESITSLPTEKPQQAQAKTRLKRRLQRFTVYALLVLGAVVFILPFMWMVTTSLKPSQEVFTFPPEFFPTTFQWQNYVDGWTVLPFNTFLLNSVIITASGILGNLTSCSLAAYAFARMRARGKNILFVLMLGTMMIPNEITIIPTFI